MLAGNWRYYIALGGLILTLALPIPGLAEQLNDQGHSADTEADAGESEGYTAPQEQVPVEVPGGPEVVTPAVADLNKSDDTAADAARETQRQEEDLEAQQDMARWAENMFWATVASVLVASIAVFFVFRSLKEARKATKAALKAAHEAENAVRVTQEIGHKQLRAYVSVLGATRYRRESHPDDPWEIHFTVTNFGQTPAYDLGVAAVHRIISNEDEPTFAFDDPANISGYMWLAPGQEYSAQIIAPDLKPNWAAFKAGTLALFLWGKIEFRDADGCYRWVRFRMVHRGGYKLGLEYCERGNYTSESHNQDA